MKINESFKDFIFDYKTYISILYGGAGSSKSHSWTQKIILKCLQQKRKVLVMRATQTSLKDSCIALFKSILDEDDIPYEYRKLDAEIKIGESVILFKGGDNPERLKSIAGVTDIVLEEATEMTPDMFTQLMLRLRSQVEGLQITIAFNPVSRNNWVYRFFFDTEDPDYFIEGMNVLKMHSTYKDNAFLPPTYIKTLLSLRKSSPYYYTVYVEGEFGTLGKLIFPHGTYSVKNLVIPQGAKPLCGMDPGVVDKFAIEYSHWWMEPDGTRTLYTHKELCESGILNRSVAEWIKSTIPGHVTIWGDNAGASQIRELQNLGCHNVRKNTKPPGSIVTDIDTIKSFDRWVVSPDCPCLLKDLSIYQWHKDKQTGLYTMEPERVVDGYHCDAIDGVRYSMEGLNNTIGVIKLKNYQGL